MNLEKYEQWLLDHHTLSDRTRTTYHMLVSQVDLEDLNNSLRIHKNKDADKSYNLRIVALKNYAKYLEEVDPDDELIQQIRKLQGIRFVRSKTHMPYTKLQVQLIFDNVKGWKRQAVLIALYTGLRKAEIQAINTHDIDFEKKVLTVVKGKGNKSRKVPIPEILLDELLMWRDRRDRMELPTINWLYTSTGYRPSFGSGQVLRPLSKKVGFNVKWHSLRATYAKHVYEKSNNDIRLVQILLGHESISTTQKYLSFFDEELRTKVENLGDFYE